MPPAERERKGEREQRRGGGRNSSTMERVTPPGGSSVAREADACEVGRHLAERSSGMRCDREMRIFDASRAWGEMGRTKEKEKKRKEKRKWKKD